MARRHDGTSVFSWQAPSGRRSLAGVRMLLSVFGEMTNIGTNVLDHTVRLAERLSFHQKYLPNRLRQYAGQKRMVVLLHGYAQGRACFETMERILSSPLFKMFPVSSGYQPYSQDIRISAEQERERIEYILARTDVKEVAFIGHSQGGLLIRDLLQRQQFTDRVKNCIFLATPHMGTWAAVLGYAHWLGTRVGGLALKRLRLEGESAFQMIPQSRYLRALNEMPLPPGISYTNIYNYIDPLVWPASFARLPYPEAHNILFLKIGHLQTLYDLQELELILRGLMFESEREPNFATELVGEESVLERRNIEGESTVYEEVVASSTS